MEFRQSQKKKSKFTKLQKVKMKTKNLFGLFLGIVLLIVSTSIVSAGLSIVHFNDADNQHANSITVTQGTPFSVEVVAISNNGEKFLTEKLELVNERLIFQLFQQGNYQGNGIYTYSNTHTVDTKFFDIGNYILRFSVTGDQGSYAYMDLPLKVITPSANSPIVSITSPINSQVYTLPVLFTYTANDIDGDLDACRYSLDNGFTFSSWQSCTGSFGIITPNIGINNWSVQARDSAGNVNSDEVVFFYNPITVNAPIVNIISPISIVYNTQVNQIIYIPTDVDGDLQSCWYSTDGGITFSTPSSCINGQTNVFTVLNANQGINTWVVYAKDFAGNIGMASVTFTLNISAIDTFAPVITPITPTNNQKLTSNKVNLLVAVNEVANVTYNLNAGPNILMTQLTGLTFTSGQITLNRGETYTLTYTATDLAGNVATKTIYFEISEETIKTTKHKDNGTTSDNYYDILYATQNNRPTIITGIDPIVTIDKDCDLNIWQRFVNWLRRLFGLKEKFEC